MTEEPKPAAEPVIRYGDWQASIGVEVFRIPILAKNGRVYSKSHKDRAVEETQYGWFLFLETHDGWVRIGGADFRSATQWLSGVDANDIDFLNIAWTDAPPTKQRKKSRSAPKET